MLLGRFIMWPLSFKCHFLIASYQQPKASWYRRLLAPTTTTGSRPASAAYSTRNTEYREIISHYKHARDSYETRMTPLLSATSVVADCRFRWTQPSCVLLFGRLRRFHSPVVSYCSAMVGLLTWASRRVIPNHMCCPFLKTIHRQGDL